MSLQCLPFLLAVALSLSLCAALLPSLTDKSLWRLNIKLNKDGYKQVEISARIRFCVQQNFEPPQGRVFVEDDFNGFLRVDEKGYNSNWKLSEDINDRKDGLWVWGLFEVPKYPFLYFNMPVFDTYILPSGEEEKIPFEIAGSVLRARFNHVEEKETGVQLSEGLLNMKLTEMMRADPFGVGGAVNVGDEVTVGTISLTPVRE